MLNVAQPIGHCSQRAPRDRVERFAARFFARPGLQIGHGPAPRYLWPRLQVFQPPRFGFGMEARASPGLPAARWLVVQRYGSAGGMKSKATAPMKATMITPASPPTGTPAPRVRRIQPPTNAPTIPMMMSPTRPYPVPPITIDASTPATSPTINHVKRSIQAPRKESFSPQSNARACLDTTVGLAQRGQSPRRTRISRRTFFGPDSTMTVEPEGRTIILSTGPSPRPRPLFPRR